MTSNIGARKITDNTFHEYINPEGKIIPPETYMVHKISNAFLEDKPKMSEVAPKFLEFIGDSPIVAHNGLDFDFPFVNHELAKLNLPQIPRSQQLDSIVIARNRVFGPKSYTLDALAKWFGISLTARADAHGALIDSEILAKVYMELENTAPAPDVNEIIAQEIAGILKDKNIFMFNDAENGRTFGGSGYQATFFLIRDFFQNYREEILASRKYGDMQIIFDKVGEENFNALNELFHEFNEYFSGMKIYTYYNDREKQLDTDLTRKHDSLVQRRDEILQRMNEYSNQHKL